MSRIRIVPKLHSGVPDLENLTALTSVILSFLVEPEQEDVIIFLYSFFMLFQEGKENENDKSFSYILFFGNSL